MRFVREFYRFIIRRRQYWMVPVFFMMLVFGGFIVLVEGSAIAPFVYTLF
jgi:hypothetical protein